MLLGIVRLSDVYIRPSGPVLWANVFSEVIIGNGFTIAALVASTTLLTCPEDRVEAAVMTELDS